MMSPVFTRFVSELRLRGVILEPEDICDAVWLSSRGIVQGTIGEIPQDSKQIPTTPPQPPPLPKTPASPDYPAPQPQSQTQPQTPPSPGAAKADQGVHALGNSTGSRMAGSPIALPTAATISRSVEIDRAFRPLRQKRQTSRHVEVDEEATAAAISETGVWQVVTRPVRGRWLDISLVVEQSPTMRLWQDTAIEFRNLLWRACAPRSLRTFHLRWSIGTDRTRTVVETPGGRQVSPEAPCGPGGNRVVLVLSDAFSLGWMTADIPVILAKWAKRHPTTLVQVLPPPIWSRTALRQVEKTLVMVNRECRTAIYPRCTKEWPWLTVTGLEPNLLRNYARFMAGSSGDGVAAFQISSKNEQFQVVTQAAINKQLHSKPDSLQKKEKEIENIFARFQGFATPEARKLAYHLASAPLILPVMRLVQRTLVPDAVPAQLAELFLSGIIYRQKSDKQESKEPHPDQIEYDFLPGLRERFYDHGGIDCSFETTTLLSHYLEQRFGKGGLFTALLADPKAVAAQWNVATSAEGLHPFARIASFLLERMGYESEAALVSKTEEIKTTPNQPIPPSRTNRTVFPASKAEYKSTAKSDRSVRVFVSSTFRDMHVERDELQKFVFPKLRHRCESLGVTCDVVDLRWGITEEEWAEGHAIPITFGEINRCRPYFIGLLGERYGWVPDKIPQELIEREPWLKEHLGTTGKSVTELEILHGVLNNPDMAEHAFFYFRDPAYIESIPQEKRKDFTAEDAEGAEKLRILKEKIRGSGQPVRENYPNPKKLGERVLEDLWNVIDKKFPLEGVPTTLERERMDHEAFAVARQKVYIGREAYFKRLDDHVASAGLPLVVLGESGSGKSALIANWARKYREGHPDDFMVFHYIGGTADSADYVKILRRIMEEIKERYEPKGKEGIKDLSLSKGSQEDEIPYDPKKVVEIFPAWLAKAAARGRFILVLDALNQLEDKDNAPDLGWLPQFFPENVRVILSTLTAEKERDLTAEDAGGAREQAWRRQYNALKKRGWQTVQVELLTLEERKRLIEESLARFARKLSTEAVDKIIAAQQTANPLYICTLLDELCVHGEHDTLVQRIDHYLEAGTIDALYEKVLERYEVDYEYGKKGLVRDVLSLLWASRRGLSEAELLELLGAKDKPMPRAYWSPLYHATKRLLVNRSGLLNLFHDHLRKAVEDKYLRDTEQKRLAYLQLADYFEKKPLDARKVDELPWLLCQAEERNRLRACLIDIDQFLLIQERDQNELMGYWVWLREERVMGKGYQKSFESWSGKPGNQDLLISYAANQLGAFLLGAALHAEAEPLMRRALRIDAKSFDENHPNVARDLNNLAQLLQATNRLAEAEPLVRRALKIDEQSFGENHPNVARGLNNLAKLLQATNRLAEAEPLVRRALMIDEQSFGENHPNVAIGLNNLAQLLQATNRLAEAEPLMRRALKIDEQSFGENHPNAARGLNNLATLLQATNRLAEAEPLVHRALRIDEQSFGENHPNVAGGLNNLARLLQATNRLAEAEPLVRRALRIDEQSFGANHPNVARGLNNLAQLLQATNRLAEAEPLSRRMVAILLEFTSKTGHPHPHLHDAVNNYAGLLQAMGRSANDIRSDLKKLGQRYGVDLGGAGGQANAEPSPKLRAVIEHLVRDPSKVNEIAAKLQREDPALLRELLHWIQSQQQE